MKLSKILSTGIFLLLLSFANVSMAAPPDVITTDQLYTGMRGIGKTVVAGIKIEEFDVEVIDVMKKMGGTGGDLILVRVSGDVIKRTGGVAQGMSGSPVYFDGKLAGAVAFGWSLTDPTICMLTPINEMLYISDNMRIDWLKRQEAKSKYAINLLDDVDITNPDDVKQTDDVQNANNDDTNNDANTSENEDKNSKDDVDFSEDYDVNTEDEDEYVFANEEKDNNEYSVIERKTGFHNLFPKGTAIMASGFSERGLAIIQEEFKDYNIVPYSVGSAPEVMNDVNLEPGSAVSVEVIKGDVSLGALGTVTWVDEDEVLAFGHSFTKRGNVNFFLSNAWTYTTISSINSPFKIGAPGKLLGTILQDRNSGVAGKLNNYPDVIPVIINVDDTTRNIQRTASVQIIQDELFSPVLAHASVVSIIDKALDRQGEGTATVNFTIRAQNLPDGKELKRENMFYSLSNVRDVLAMEMALGMQMLSKNRFQEVRFTDVTIDIKVTDTRETAAILSAKSLVEEALPGETIGIEVVLQPFRGEKVTRVVKFTVPKDHKEGTMALMFRGGASLVYLQNLYNQQHSAEAAVLLRSDKNKDRTFAMEIDEFNNGLRNNDLVIDLLFGTAGAKETKKKKEPVTIEQKEKQENEYVQGSEHQKVLTLPYVITGETTLGVKIVKQKS